MISRLIEFFRVSICRELISELRKYADFHFASEENIASSCNLPAVSGHHQRHTELLEEFNQRAEDFDRTNNGENLIFLHLLRFIHEKTFYNIDGISVSLFVDVGRGSHIK
jgi:hemerythrin